MANSSYKLTTLVSFFCLNPCSFRYMPSPGHCSIYYDRVIPSWQSLISATRQTILNLFLNSWTFWPIKNRWSYVWQFFFSPSASWVFYEWFKCMDILWMTVLASKLLRIMQSPELWSWVYSWGEQCFLFNYVMLLNVGCSRCLMFMKRLCMFSTVDIVLSICMRG